MCRLEALGLKVRQDNSASLQKRSVGRSQKSKGEARRSNIEQASAPMPENPQVGSRYERLGGSRKATWVRIWNEVEMKSM
ncbi:MAG: hypothetical protein JWR14_4395 [Caballeronia sp.]|jgi:hypothetical protein|nr:hypothetical protein [Caballeronia sp.]